jgi:parallel beta-helix repeat protein
MTRLAMVLAVLSLAVIPGQAFATHVACGDTITQDTTLDSDLIGCTGDFGIAIGADDVTLDFNGHRLTGRVVGDVATNSLLDVGVLNQGHHGVTIENGNVSGADYGIGLVGVHGNTLRFMEAIHGLFGCSAPALYLSNSDGNRIESSAFFGWCSAVQLVDSSNNRFRNNRTGYFLCGEEGNCGVNATGGSVEVNRGSGNSFERNSLSQGEFSLSNTRQNTVRRNVVSLSIGAGISSSAIFGGQGNLIEKNEVFGNLDRGIVTANGERIVKNVVHENRKEGILVFGDPAEIIQNRASSNGSDGILVGRSTGMLIRHNIATDNARDGINITDLSIGTIVAGNTADENGDDGIDSDSPSTILRHNTASLNADLGIEAVSGTIDDRHNRAFGNGNPLQCLNVICR